MHACANGGCLIFAGLLGVRRYVARVALALWIRKTQRPIVTRDVRPRSERPTAGPCDNVPPTVRSLPPLSSRRRTCARCRSLDAGRAGPRCCQPSPWFQCYVAAAVPALRRSRCPCASCVKGPCGDFPGGSLARARRAKRVMACAADEVIELVVEETSLESTGGLGLERHMCETVAVG